MEFPIHEYSHSTGCSVSGGYVYRGCAIPDLQGTYFFADYCSSNIWSFRYDGKVLSGFQDRTVELDPPLYSISSISSFGEDAAGEMYICDLFGGEVFKIVPVTPLDPADINGDGTVDLLDSDVLTQVLLGVVPGPSFCEVQRADVNQDGLTNGLDVQAWLDEL